MSNVAIKVENLGKKYVINHKKGNGDDNFREVVIGSARKIITSLNPFVKRQEQKDETEHEEFWALKDVNFDINKGDKVGIIGRNGAGKSTLLKVLSRITEPTAGKIHINGRIASLLEVGTGFHPELTGRENIFLNGAILGMSRAEIKAKFDEIVAFAEVEKFLDTPVKRYSSGMYVRLAFSVAAHLEPEILIVDEVLAVGDMAFQKKCLSKMNEVSEEGRTILFVSHNISAILQLTNKCILLENGQISLQGNSDFIVDQYLKQNSKEVYLHQFQKQNESIIFKSLKYIENSTNYFNAPISFKLTIDTSRSIDKFVIALGIHNNMGVRILTAKNIINIIDIGEQHLLLKINDHHLSPSLYSISIGIFEGERNLLYTKEALSFEIPDAGITDHLLIPYLLKHRGKIGAFYHLKIINEKTACKTNTWINNVLE